MGVNGKHRYKIGYLRAGMGPRRHARACLPMGKTVRGSISRVLYASKDGGDHSSGMPVAEHLMQPTRTTTRKQGHVPSLFGLAPGGVYPAMAVTGHAVRSYRTLSPLPLFQKEERRFAFCGTFPRVTSAGRYPASCFRGARTFLPCLRKGDHPTL